MTRPRSELVDRDNGGFYHLVSRCVRRAWLCGDDPLTGINYDHRRDWIEARILTLTEFFPIYVYGYAVMSNHYHIVVHYRPFERDHWTDEEIARRWLGLFPPRRPEDLEARIRTLVEDADRIEVLRDQLSDISWYMRCLNEPVARMANREDDCTGRFWEGRFDSYSLPDERAAYACMAYSDLNPVRAGITRELDAKEHTSLQRRLEEAREEPEKLAEPVAPLKFNKAEGLVVTATTSSALEMTLAEYRKHVEWAAGLIPGITESTTDAPSTLQDPNKWLTALASFRRGRRAKDRLPRWIESLVLT